MFWSFVFRLLGFVSNFEIRLSCFPVPWRWLNCMISSIILYYHFKMHNLWEGYYPRFSRTPGLGPYSIMEFSFHSRYRHFNRFQSGDKIHKIYINYAPAILTGFPVAADSSIAKTISME